jgi:hypothetical protein
MLPMIIREYTKIFLKNNSILYLVSKDQVSGIVYFFLRNIRIGTPEKLKFSLSLFSRYLRYGSFTYCGRLAKNANEGVGLGNWVTYLIFMYFPLVAGGG